MNLRNLLIPLLLSITTVLLLRQFFNVDKNNTDSSQIQSGTDHIAPTADDQDLMKDVHRRLKFEVDFIDDEAVVPVVKTAIETDFARYSFSSEGAALESAELKHDINGQADQAVWLDVVKSQAREDRCFLLAFENKTPYNYRLIAHEQNLVDQNNSDINGDKVAACDTKTVFDTLTYQADFALGTVTKKFYIYKHLCRLDLEVGLELNKNLGHKNSKSVSKLEPVRLRLFVPAPQVTDQRDIVKGVFNYRGAIQKRDRDKLAGSYWANPSAFGAETHYFITAMVRDLDHFTQRGYYNFAGLASATAILETRALDQVIGQPTKFRLEFYLGPKKVSTIAAVEPRLEQVLEYGMLAPLTKLFFNILNFLDKYTHSYGWAIILLTLLLKLLMLPLNLRAERAKQSPKQEQDYQKKLKYIQQKYSDDREALLEAQSELMRKHSMPGGIIGCLPMLLQFPIFISLRGVLSNSIELYQAPFLWIPNLTAQDPYYILPILLCAATIMYSSSSKSSDPKQRLIGIMIGLVFCFFMSGFSAGLVLYFLVSASLDILTTTVYRAFFAKRTA